MTKNIENIEKPITIESKGQRDLILQELRIRKENQQLRKDNQLLSDELTYFKEHCAELEDEVNWKNRQINALKMRCSNYNLEIGKLSSEIQDMKLTHKMLNSEEAGRAFARELLGKPMTHEDLAIESAENCYKPYTAEDF